MQQKSSLSTCQDCKIIQSRLLQKKISFNESSMAQIKAFLLRVRKEEFDKIYQKLDIGDAASGDSRGTQIQTMLSQVQGEKGPHTLLSAMSDRHVRTFLTEHWQQIARDNFGEDTDEDYIDYDMRTCQLCILWGWAHM